MVVDFSAVSIGEQFLVKNQYVLSARLATAV